MINGNHDNHTSEEGLERISILDILHKSQYVIEYPLFKLNYFGKIVSHNEITVKPLIFFKGRVRVAVYGIGYVEDY